MKTSYVIMICALASCGVNSTQPVSKAEIAATEVSLTEAVKVANLCLAQAVGPCTVPATRLAIIGDAHSAYEAFKILQSSKSPAATTALTIAIAQLIRDTPTTK